MTNEKKPRTVHEAFLEEWEWQRGALMLKDENEGKEWKKTVGEFFFQQGYVLGVTAASAAPAEVFERVIALLRSKEVWGEVIDASESSYVDPQKIMADWLESKRDEVLK